MDTSDSIGVVLIVRFLVLPVVGLLLALFLRSRAKRINSSTQITHTVGESSNIEGGNAELEIAVAAAGPRRYSYAGSPPRRVTSRRRKSSDEEALAAFTVAASPSSRWRRRRRWWPAGGHQVLVGVVVAGKEGVRGRGEDHYPSEASQSCAVARLVRLPQGSHARLRTCAGREPREAYL